MFSAINNPQSRKAIADVIFATFDNEVVSNTILKERFGYLRNETINDFISMMQNINLVESEQSFKGINAYRVIPRKIDDLPSGVLNLLMKDGRYTKKEVKEKLQKLPPIKKKRVSQILSDKESKFDWGKIETAEPPIGTPVAIRFYNPEMNYGMNATSIIEAEDLKIAEFDGEKWTILPPYPLYDYSPLSNKGQLKEGSIVTHWSYVDKESLKGWNTRFDVSGKYKLLNVEVDKEHEEILYKALLRASGLINATISGDPENYQFVAVMSQYLEILNDLQACMDLGKPITNWEEKEDGMDNKE